MDFFCVCVGACSCNLGGLIIIIKKEKQQQKKPKQANKKYLEGPQLKPSRVLAPDRIFSQAVKSSGEFTRCRRTGSSRN